jgi:hypothetical protein
MNHHPELEAAVTKALTPTWPDIVRAKRVLSQILGDGEPQGVGTLQACWMPTASPASPSPGSASSSPAQRHPPRRHPLASHPRRAPAGLSRLSDESAVPSAPWQRPDDRSWRPWA